MFKEETEEIYVELAEPGKKLAESLWRDPTLSKIGGTAAWFSSATRLAGGNLTCARCSSRLYLVAQVYAPTNIRRSLCVFGCNKAVCSSTSEGWRCIRTQEPENNKDDSKYVASAVDEPRTDVSTIEQSVLPVGLNVTDKTTDSWTNGLATGDDWADDSNLDGDWGEIETASTHKNDHIDEALSILLASKEREKVSSIKPPPPLPTVVKHTKLELHAERGVMPSHVFPAYQLDFYPEPWDAHNGAVDDAVDEKLQKYLAEEEDPALVELIKDAMAKGSSKGTSGKTKKGGKKGAEGEHYERTPAKVKAMIKFSDRLKRAPKQVVRYACGGLPLWCGAKSQDLTDACASVPPCACGAPRQFEFQLMPTLLHALGVDRGWAVSEAQCDVSIHCPDGVGESANTRTSRAGSDVDSISHEEFEDDLGADGVCESKEYTHAHAEAAASMHVAEYKGVEKGFDDSFSCMDWGVVAVWSCSASCHMSCEECIVVQPSSGT